MLTLQKIDWLAFIGALLAAPTLVAILGGIFIVPLFALPLGAPTYLTFGTTTFILFIKLGLDNPLWFIPAGLIAHAVSIPVMDAWSVILQAHDLVEGMGWFFAPLWGFVFGMLYRSFGKKLDEPAR